jgi:hypothetical protein
MTNLSRLLKASALSAWLLTAPLVADASTRAKWELLAEGIPANSYLLVKESEIRCYRRKPFTTAEILAGISEFRSGQSGEKEFGELRIANEDSALLGALDLLLRTEQKEYSRDALESLAGLRNSLAPVGAIEAIEKVFGKEIGPRLLYLALRFHVNASHFQTDKASPWRAEELDTVLLALSDLPKHLAPLPAKYADTPYQKLVHYRRGEVAENDPLTSANAHIHLFDLWNDETPFSRRATVVHEIAHTLQSLISSEKNWISFSPWATPSGFRGGPSSASFVTAYAMENHFEDFAESVVVYRYRPQWLKKRSPEKYEYLRDVIFSGVEYIDETSCTKGGALAQKWESQSKAKFAAYTSALRSSGKYALPELTSKRTQCHNTFLLERVGEEKTAAANYGKCLAALHLANFGKLRALDHRYSSDITDVLWRLAGANPYRPSFDADTIARMIRAGREEIRGAVESDYRRFASQFPESAKSADVYAEAFVRRALGTKESALGKLGFTAEDDLQLEILVRRSFEAAFDSRASYVKIWESFVGFSRPTPEEFTKALADSLE